MKPIYNLAGLMRKLNVDSFSELQERGFDVRGYLERREQELTDELKTVKYGLQELDARDEELAMKRKQSKLNEENDSQLSRASVKSSSVLSPYSQQRASSNSDNDGTPFSLPRDNKLKRTANKKYYSHNNADTDLPSNYGFDPQGFLRDPDYIYIGT